MKETLEKEWKFQELIFLLGDFNINARDEKEY
jgi:hypothetical protein